MVMKSLRDGAQGGVTKFILFGFLGLATGGLVLMDVGGFFRGGITNTDVARVGDQTISIGTFDRNLRRTLGNIGMSPQEAYKMGYVNQVLAGDVRALLLNQSAKDLDVLVPDTLVAKQINTLVQPMVNENSSAKDVLNQILRNQGMSEGEFAASIARDMENNLVYTALEKSFAEPSEQMLIDLYKAQNETRDIQYVTFLKEDAKLAEAPTEEQLQELYNATRESYATNELRTYKIITVDSAALKKTISISDEEIKDTYESNIDLYSVPATWTIEQAIVPTQEQADKIHTAAKTAPLKSAVKKVTGNESAFIASKETDEASLIESIKQSVMDAKENTLLDPVKSPLGWHVVKVASANPARTRPLSEVKAEIKDELMESLIIDQQYDLANAVDDMFAGGATLEEVAEEIDLNIQTAPAINQFGLNAEGKDGLSDYSENRAIIAETGATLTDIGETSPIFESANGEFLAVHLADITPKTYKPFAELKDTLEKRWINDQARLNNRARVQAALVQLGNGDKTLKDLGKVVRTKKALKRDQELSKPLLQHSIANIFEAEINKPVAIDIEGGAAIAVVTDFNWPKTDTNSEGFKKYKAAFLENVKNETLGIFLTAQQEESKAEINNKLLKQAYGSDQQSY